MSKLEDFATASQTYSRKPGITTCKLRRQDMKNGQGEQMGAVAFSTAGEERYSLYLTMPASGWLKLRDEIDLMLRDRRFVADVESAKAINVLDNLAKDKAWRERQVAREASQQALKEWLAMSDEERELHPEVYDRIPFSSERSENR